MAISMSEVCSREVLCINTLVPGTEAGPPEPQNGTWMTPILEYITSSGLPEDPDQARKIKRQAPRFTIIDGLLYRRSFQGPLLKCLAGDDAQYVLEEIHQGCCGEHLGGVGLARKTLLAGFWWPTVNKDSLRVVQTCAGCQHFATQPRNPVSSLTPVFAACPFDQWGMDIVGPFPTARAQKKFLLVAVDYFSKWVEAEPLARITEEEVLKFLWKNIVCRFGIPRKLVSDNGRQFQGRRISAWCQEMKITQSFTSVAYPQANGQAEVTNRTIVQALGARLYGVGKDWVEELPSVLWAYRTTPRTATKETPFSMVYGSEAVLPAEIGQSSARVSYYSEQNDQLRAQEMDLVEERRERAFIRMEAYKTRIANFYNKKVRPRNFQVGDLVLKKASPTGDPGKLQPKWEGPFKIIRRVGSDTYYLENNQGKILQRPWNAYHLRKFYS